MEGGKRRTEARRTAAGAGDERPLGVVALLEVLRAPDQRAARELEGQVQAERQREHGDTRERQWGGDRGQHDQFCCLFWFFVLGARLRLLVTPVITSSGSSESRTTTKIWIVHCR